VDFLSFLVPIIFIIIVVTNVLAKAKQAQQAQQNRTGDEGTAYEGNPEEIRRFLRSIGLPAGEGPEPPVSSGPPGLPPGRVTPSSRTATVRRAGGIRPTPPPRPVSSQRIASPPFPSMESGESSTKRLVVDDEHLATSVEDHLREGHLGAGAPPLEPAVEGQLRERRLGQGDKPIVPTVESNLRRERLEALPTAVAQQRAQAAGASGSDGSRQTGVTAMTGHRGIALPSFGAKNLRQALVMSEILAPPLALRDKSRSDLTAPRG
jgi:hypothetical protein